MRSENIRVHIEIPIQVNSTGTSPHFTCDCFRDKNGTVYELQAIKNACDDANKNQLPIIQYNDDGEPVPIGIAHTVKYNPAGYIEIDGVIKFGGTSEEIDFSSTKDVTSMEIESIGFSV